MTSFKSLLLYCSSMMLNIWGVLTSNSTAIFFGILASAGTFAYQVVRIYYFIKGKRNNTEEK